MKPRDLKIFLFFVVVAVLFHACSSTENTVQVVKQSARTEQATEESEAEENQPFTEITLGMIDPVTNFDPLFAENLSAQRALSLIYEGLYTLDAESNPIPGIAGSVEISDDSLEYVFKIDQDQYFQNSPVFSTGIGRRVTASDIKWDFERTAKAGVPTHAAELLMGISGFENYYLEQRTVYDPEKRVLKNVTGIQVINSQTLGIILDEKDPHFLQKLASPYLYIYPPEAVNNIVASLAKNPIGTGSYRLNQIVDSTQVILSKYETNSGQQSGDSLINRINLDYFSDEGQMLQAFSSGKIDWIPEIGPQLSDQILDDNENLKVSYDSYHLVKNNEDRIITLHLNDQATVNEDWLINRLAYLTDEDFVTRGKVTLNVDDFEITEGADPMPEYYVAYTDDPIARRIFTELHNIVFRPESSLVFFDIRVPTRRVSLYSSNSNSFYESLNPMNNHYWLRLDTQIFGLYNERVTGIKPTSVPWQLNIKDISVKNTREGT